MKIKAGFLACSTLLLAMVPMWLFVVGEIRHDRNTAHAAARADSMNLATAFEAHVRSVIQLMDAVLLNTREDVFEQPEYLSEHVADEIKAYGNFVSQLAIIDKNGLLTFSNLAAHTEPVDLSDREHFRVHRDNPQRDSLYISKPVLGRISKQWTIQFTRPIHHNGEFAGVMVLSVPTTFFSDYYQQIDVGPNGSIVLLGIDRTVRAIASGAPGASNLELYDQPALLENNVYFDPEGPMHGYFEGVTFIDGQYRLAAYRRLEQEDAVVVVLLSPEDFMAPFEERRHLLIASAGVISLLLLAVALLVFILAGRHLRATAELRVAHKQMKELVNTDTLTGVSSRRYFLDRVTAELDRTRRHGGRVSLLMLDIDHFKQVNDQYGHPGGDIVLKHFAAVCKSTLRSHDLIGRLGGEEFVVALPETELEGAYCVAEKLRLAVASTPIDVTNGPVAITVSIGLTTSSSDPEESLQSLMSKADAALYAAKQSGRNKVCVAGPKQPDQPPKQSAPSAG